MQAIDRVGAFRGKIKESGVGTTKNGFPRFVAVLSAAEKYVDEQAEMKQFELAEPGWVDWSEYDAELTGYFTLFGGEKQNGEKTGNMVALDFQFEALNRALGWDGSSLSALGSTDWSDKTVMFWVEENEYEGKTDLKVAAIDAADASPTRSIRTLEVSALKDLDTKFAGMMKQKTVVAAKAPAKPPAKAGKASPAASAAKPAASASAPAAPATSKESPSKPPKAKALPPKSEPAASESITYKDGADGQAQSWDEVLKRKGKASDTEVGDKFLDACAAIAPGKDETGITGEQWSKITEETVKKLAA